MVALDQHVALQAPQEFLVHNHPHNHLHNHHQQAIAIRILMGEVELVVVARLAEEVPEWANQEQVPRQVPFRAV